MSTQDTIEIFLTAAQDRMANLPGRVPFDSRVGNLVINWLRALAPHYANGEDISQ